MISVELQTTLKESKGRDLAEVMPRIAEIAARSIRLNFTMGGRPAWPPLKSGETPLVASGRLYRSIHTEVGSDWAEVIAGPHPAARVHQFGAQVPVTEKSKRFFWAMFHETGDTKWKYMALQRVGNRMKIPARPYMVLQDTDIAAITKLVGEFTTSLI